MGLNLLQTPVKPPFRIIHSLCVHPSSQQQLFKGCRFPWPTQGPWADSTGLILGAAGLLKKPLLIPAKKTYYRLVLFCREKPPGCSAARMRPEDSARPREQSWPAAAREQASGWAAHSRHTGTSGLPSSPQRIWP